MFRNRLFWFSAIALIILGLHMADVTEFLTRPYLGRAFDLSGKSGMDSAETPDALTPHPLRHQPCNRPTPIRLQGVSKAIVQAVGTPLPKLKALRCDAIAAPLIRQRYPAICKPGFDFRKLCLKQGPRGNHLTLP